MDKAMRLIWIDLEMTGLNPDEDTIIEIATIVTDEHLNQLAEGPSIAIKHPDEVFDSMNEWCIEHHGNSGLTQRCKESTVYLAQAEQQTISFLREWVDQGASPICGNSVGQDRRFLVEHMPELADFFHYRTIDVSTIKELARRWAPEVLASVQKSGAHLALDDIKESIEELKVYRKQLFNLD